MLNKIHNKIIGMSDRTVVVLYCVSIFVSIIVVLLNI